jgi:hypothetical protein
MRSTGRCNRTIRTKPPARSDPEGIGTHGTHICDIAAGSGEIPGVAPGADIIFVHLTSNDTSPLDTLGDSARVLEAARYIKDRADGRPVVLSFSMGRTGGPKDGTTLVEQGLDALCAEGPGCAVVMSAGNYFASRQHSSGVLEQPGDSADLLWEVQALGSQAAEMEIWYPGQCALQADLIDPGGRIAASVLWENAPTGVWTVRLSALETSSGSCPFDAYIERDDPRSQSRFPEAIADPWGTTNTVCNGHRTIAIGAYDPHLPDRPMLGFSSAGPTRDGRQKPDCIAPGGSIRAAKSTTWEDGVRLTNSFTTKSGTSMAAPHAAGTLALMFEAARPEIPDAAVLKRLLLESCRSTGESTRTGAGRIHAGRAVQLTREWRDARQRETAATEAAAAKTTNNDSEETPRMPLIDAVKKICTRLAPQGWAGLMKKHGLDISASDLEKELAKPLSGIDRKIPGFEDFANEGTRGIEPGVPAHSLLYHALASPAVLQDGSGRSLKGFATMAELYTLENYIYASRKASFDDLKKKYGSDLAVAAFAYEYRTIDRSVHGFHAEMAYSRIGVARVGSAPPRYVPDTRGFTSRHATDPYEVCVTPARYGAFLAVRKKGVSTHGPMDPQGSVDCMDADRDLDFWVPVHKLFSGKECIRGAELKVSKSMFHYGVKLRRLREYIHDKSGDDLAKPPFTISDGLAAWVGTSGPGGCPGLLAPVPKKRLVDVATKKDGKPWSFPVDPILTRKGEPSASGCQPTRNPPTVIAASAGIPTAAVTSCCVNVRPSPEWIHVRFQVGKDGKITDLNKQTSPDSPEAVRAGGYNAAHMIDYTGEGWVEPNVEGLGSLKSVAAYSLLAAPDFFPFCDQRELAVWSATSKHPWFVEPTPLNRVRYAANPRIPGKKFTAKDKTCCAIVSQPYDRAGRKMAVPARRRAISWLPDASAGVFQPGWDVSIDQDSSHTPHLAQYGLGSPFPEDAMLCAALSAFWPAAAPDIARKFGSNSNIYSIAPLTDDEVGKNGAIGFDGLPGPKIEKRSDGNSYAVFPRASHSDYVKSALDKKFNYWSTADIDTLEYIRRAVAMQTVYEKLGVSGDDRSQITVLSFTRVKATDSRIASASFTEPVYRFVTTKQRVRDTPGALTNAIKLSKMDEFFVSPDTKKIQHNTI